MEQWLSFLLLCRSSLHGFSWFCVPQLLVLFGFHNSLNTDLKWSRTSDFILTFEQFSWILSWFCVASFPQLLVLFGFHNLLNTNLKRRGTLDFIQLFRAVAIPIYYIDTGTNFTSIGISQLQIYSTDTSLK